MAMRLDFNSSMVRDEDGAAVDGGVAVCWA